MSEELKTYLRNPNLKASNVKVGFTQEQIKEYIKCSKDPKYFIEKYIQIVSLDKGLVPFSLWDFQKRMVDTFHDNRFSICKLPRQSGKSTTILAYLLHCVLFQSDINIAILANKGSLARELLGRLQLAYEHLPAWLQQGIKVWNKGNIELENNSKIIAAATSSSAVRGGSYNIIFLDEFAHVPSHFALSFFNSVYPTISSGKNTKVLIVSTPNGMNLFYKMWVDAIEKRSNYSPVEINWNDIPGRDDKWKADTIANTSPEQFEQEFECVFQGSIDTLINPTVLKTLAHRNPISSNDGFDIYEYPDDEKIYAICVDVAHGKRLDYSAFVIVDITQLPYRIVGKFRNNIITPLAMPSFLYKIARQYNEATLLIEVNDVGQQVADAMNYDYEYENLFVSSVKGRKGQILGGGHSNNIQLGVRTTAQVKRMGCSTLKSLIEDKKLLIEDFDIITELSSFVQYGNSYRAEDGEHDDLVMCLVLFAWLIDQRYFKEVTDQDIRKTLEEQRMQYIEDNMTPFGVIDDGIQYDQDDSYFEDGDQWMVVPLPDYKLE